MTDASRSAPTLETERLVLRAWRRDDREPYFAILQEPAVFRHFGPDPMGMEESWRRVNAAAGSWLLNGFGGWAVERRSDGKLVGMLAMFTGWRDLDPEFGHDPEMGWIFATEAHGQGLAGEACRAALHWAEANLPPSPIWAIIAPANAPSIKLAEKLGFEHIHETRYKDDPILVLKRPAWA
ncbi:GNAT family N-acetyltransferase [Sphingomonas lutea]|uniref:GNAT family N-acetyltransferase n=1 Tax=Sphingomonas lutea TaxID=1045317 RepID=A0A7G9SFN3_9SPHN|nr:GNAT family N-acetyltransferase [Sphingomonas lutea]QNN66658.1 GNAT family N-acetyltransferase [Sphingomonas lutea]